MSEDLAAFFREVEVVREKLKEMAPDYPDYPSFKSGALARFSMDILLEMGGLKKLYEAAHS
jgi:hypothetical protein